MSNEHNSEQSDSPITVTFRNKTTTAALTNLLVRKKPPGWGRRSYSSYYNEDYARWLMRDLDRMAVDGKDTIYLYAKWPNTSRNSLYLRINHAMKFITEPSTGMDVDGKYARILSHIKVDRTNPACIALRYYRKLDIDTSVQGDSAISVSEIPKWKRDLDAWLENTSITEPFIKSGLCLTEEIIAQLELELEGSGCMCSITTTEVKVIKP